MMSNYDCVFFEEAMMILLTVLLTVIKKYHMRYAYIKNMRIGLRLLLMMMIFGFVDRCKLDLT